MRRFPWRLGFKVVLVFCLCTAFGLHFIEIADAQAAQPLTALMIEPGVAPGWWVQHADAPLTFKNMPPHSMGITTGGVVHVVYGGDHLYHAWKGRDSWYYETVDPAWGVGSLAALAIDSTGKLHVSYIDTVANCLKYATNRNGSWQVETPAIADGLSASNAAIAVDSANDPHIVFSTYDNTLRYGYFDSEYGGWVGPETLATGTGLLNYPGAFALAVGTPFATPHVSYHKHVSASNGTLYYTTRTGYDTWSTPLALAMGGDSNGDYNDIALNGNIPHIAASANTPSLELYVVRYTFLDGAIWHAAEPATTTSAPATAISLRLVGSTPTIAYQDPGVGYYWLSRTGDNNWSAEEAVVTGAGVGSWASFAWYGSYPYATYYDSSTRQFSFKYKTSGGWQTPYTLATNGHQVGNQPSLAVDTLGRSHIVYADTTAMQLLYLRYDGASWYPLTVDTGPVYSDSSLVLENNIPKVLYLGTDGSVRYIALLCAPNCTFISPEIVDSGLTLPMYHPALAIHATTGVHAAYQKNGSLIYAKRTGSNAWTTTLVDTGIYAGITMAVDASGAPHLMYRKGSNLIHAYKDTTWHTSDIIATGTFGFEYSFRISPQGLKAAVYTSFPGGSYANVVYATSCAVNPCVWVPQTIDSSGDELVDLAFDSRGVPHIAYFSMPGADLKFAERTGGATWTTKVIDSRGWVGDSLSIAVSPPDGPTRIAYRDFTNEDLKLALEGRLVFLPAVLK